MIDFYRELAPALEGRIVVYNGDTDPCVSYEGTRNAIEQVTLTLTLTLNPQPSSLYSTPKAPPFSPALDLRRGTTRSCARCSPRKAMRRCHHSARWPTQSPSPPPTSAVG